LRKARSFNGGVERALIASSREIAGFAIAQIKSVATLETRHQALASLTVDKRETLLHIPPRSKFYLPELNPAFVLIGF
jgi:hypothetical protein